MANETQLFRTIKLHVQREGEQGQIFAFGPKDVSIGSDPNCGLYLSHFGIPRYAATLKLTGYNPAELRDPSPAIVDNQGYKIIRGEIRAGNIFVIGVFTITVVEICETAANKATMPKPKENFKFKNHTLEGTISHFKDLALSDDDYSVLVQWLEETRDYRKAMYEIRDSLSKVPNI